MRVESDIVTGLPCHDIGWAFKVLVNASWTKKFPAMELFVGFCILDRTRARETVENEGKQENAGNRSSASRFCRIV
jgi:hypothetical protein